jgi:hypothetical protein
LATANDKPLRNLRDIAADMMTLDPASAEFIAANSVKNNQPLALDRNPIKGAESIEVSSSHVIRLKFNESIINKFLVDYKTTYVTKHWYIGTIITIDGVSRII